MFDKKIFSQKNLYIIGVSGGPDSMFCLDKMRLAGYKIVVVHINYQKRAESVYDQKLVSDYCQKYSLPLEVRIVEKGEYSSRLNFQAWARKIRYDFFREIAYHYQTNYIVVAHHKDDHLETFLLQSKRKNLVDYWGLSTSTQQGEFYILRPLLSQTKEQILRYLTSKKIDFVLDRTNQLPIYQRNIIRSQITNLSREEKVTLFNQIKKKNCELNKTKSLVNSQKNFFVPSPFVFQLKPCNFSSEVHLRLLYYWINRATGGLLHHRKKKLLAEVYRQLLISKKSNLVISLGSNWRIIKNKKKAIIQNIKN